MSYADTLRRLHPLAAAGRPACYDGLLDAADEIDRLTAQIEALHAELSERDQTSAPRTEPTMADPLAYVLVQDVSGTAHKNRGVYGDHNVTSLCGLDLSGREAIPRMVGPNRLGIVNHCRACSDLQDAATVAAIVAAGGRGDDCNHGYGPLDSCPCCD